MKAVRAIEPAVGTGTTESSVRSVTVLSASLAVMVRAALEPSRTVSALPQEMTIGSSGPTVCVPSPLKVSVGKPAHSTAGSKASAPPVSPVTIDVLRRSVLSAVLVSPDPHSVPGSTPI
jgi:hypothetical protein